VSGETGLNPPVPTVFGYGMLGVWHRTRLKGLGFLIDIALDELECLLMR